MDEDFGVGFLFGTLVIGAFIVIILLLCDVMYNNGVKSVCKELKEMPNGRVAYICDQVKSN